MANRKRHTKKVKQSPVLDIVVTTAGRFDMLRKCLQALEQQKNAPPFNVYVVDNATDSQERLRNKDIFEMSIITESKRLTNEVGFPALANEGARMGNSNLIMFLSDDVVLDEDVIDIVVKNFDDKKVGIVGIKLLFPEDSTVPNRPAGKVQHVGHAMNINGEIIHPLVGWSADHPKCCVTRELLSVTGACLSIRRDFFRQVGGFYEGYGLGTFEDADLCLQVNKLGKKVVVNTDAWGYHYTGATAEKKQRAFPLQQNSMIFKARWAQSGIFQWDDYTFY
jgi:GT2 family glycosyltransferase